VRCGERAKVHLQYWHCQRFLQLRVGTVTETTGHKCCALQTFPKLLDSEHIKL
jgi:hypothetical protein